MAQEEKLGWSGERPAPYKISSVFFFLLLPFSPLSRSKRVPFWGVGLQGEGNQDLQRTGVGARARVQEAETLTVREMMEERARGEQQLCSRDADGGRGDGWWTESSDGDGLVVDGWRLTVTVAVT